MIANRIKRAFPLGAVTASIMIVAGATPARAATPPVKELLAIRMGAEVNKTTKGNVCLVSSEECQAARPGSEPGAFEFGPDVAVNEDHASPQFGDVYVADGAHHRVQVLAADGSFVSMFGREVNATTKGDVCTAASKDVCQPGVQTSSPGGFGEQEASITVDPASGSVYVADQVRGEVGGEPTHGMRVQKFTGEGVWVWELGKEVNETTHGTLCTQEEATKGATCTTPAQYKFGAEPQANGSEPGTFAFEASTALTVGGPEDVLFVANGVRVEEFQVDGAFKEQFPLAGSVGERGLAVDDSCQVHEPVLTGATTPTCASFDVSNGDLYVAYKREAIISKLAPNGSLLAEFTLSARSENGEDLFVGPLAIDPSGRLAVSEAERSREPPFEMIPFGSLLNGVSGHLITEFHVPGASPLVGIAFSAEDGLYGGDGAEVLGYGPVPVAELATGAAPCSPGGANGTSVTFDCTLNGEANAEEVANTEGWFQWGLGPALGETTPVQTICTSGCGGVPVALAPALIHGVRPNQLVFFRVAGRDQNVVAPEQLSSDTTSFTTPAVAPRVVGAPSVLFLRSSSAVLFNSVNPENASSEYFFEYGPALAGYCEGSLRSGVLQSSVYGETGATLEVKGLQPDTTYQYRLCATNAAGKAVDEHGTFSIPEGVFTTAPASAPQAATGGFSALTATSVTISGTVNPDGQAATYAFELGLDQGSSTQFGVVRSGEAGAGITPVEEQLAVGGLQPGISYTYRITVKSSTGAVSGAPVTFTTTGLPSVLMVLTPLPMLAIPSIAFPAAPRVAPPTPNGKKKAKKRTHKQGKIHKRKPHRGKK